MAVSPEERIGRFVLLRRLGASSLATVYEARDAETATPVALKVLSRYVAEDSRLVEEFFSSTRRVARLGHPHIVALIDTGQDGSSWVATEFMARGSLKQRAGTAQDPSEVGKALSQIGAALDAAHGGGVLHGDLKPANVFMTDPGDYKLGDFGMARLAAGMHALIRSSSSTPSPPYMSPEQALNMTLTERSDVYSLGVLAYHLLTGQVPFPGMDPATVWAKQLKGPPPDPSALNPAVPDSVSKVLLTAMAKDPQHRFATAMELADAFRDALRQHTVARTPASVGPAQHSAGARGAGPSAPALAPVTNAPQPPSDVVKDGALSSYWEGDVSGKSHLPDQPGARSSREGGLAGTAFAKMGERARTALALAAAVLTVVLMTIAVDRLTLPPTPVSSLSAAPLPGQWAMYQRDPMHSGYAPGPSPTFQGSVQWSFLMSQPLLAAPAVDADTVYVATGDRRVVALRASDGSVRWELPVSTPIDGTPALAGDRAYVGLRNGNLLAIDRGSGAIRWSRDTRGAIFSSPLVYNGALYIGNGDLLEAIDARTGRSLWRFHAGGEIDSPPAVTEDGVLVFGSRDGNVYFLEASNGKTRLVYRTVVAAASGAAVHGKIAYVGVDDGAVLALDTTQRQRPLDKQILRVRNQLAVWNMGLRVATQRGHVWGVSAARDSASTPAVADSLLVVATRDGKVHGIEEETGRRRWSFTTGTKKPLPPIIVGDTAYVSSTSGKVYGLKLDTGELAWQWDASGGGLLPSTGPVIGGGVLYVGASQERATVTLTRKAEDGSSLPSDDSEAADGWYYRYGGSPCSPGEKQPVGPFFSRGEAFSAANFNAPGCGALYAVQ